MLRTFTLSLLLSSFALSCQVPVFRYALERWQADKYRLQVIHKKPLVRGPQDLIDQAKSQSEANPSTLNLEIETIDANALTEAEQWSIPGLEMIETFPSHVLTAPDDLNITEPILLANTTKSSLGALMQSPARSEIIKRLLNGDSTVYLHILSGDKSKDQAVRKILDEALIEAQKSISLPEGVIRPDQIAEAQSQGEIDFEDVLRSSVPLKIAFTVLSLDPNSPEEQEFIKILLKGKSMTQLPESSFIAPIFGRGRCLGLIPASKVSKTIIIDQCQYLCNACACSVKSQNPGYDLVMQANWDKQIADSTVIIDKDLPELTGTGDFLSDDPPRKENQPSAQSENMVHSREPHTIQSSLKRNLIIATGMISLLLLAGLIYYKRSNKQF